MNYKKFVTPVWAETIKEMDETFSQGFPADYLQHPLLDRHLTFGSALEAHAEWAWLLTQWDHTELCRLLEVEPEGHPFFYGDPDGMTPPQIKELIPGWTTRTTIHHLYHLTVWQQVTGCSLFDVDYVVEWGGGFGNLAKIAKRINPGLTWIIIDFPIMSRLQKQYLSSINPYDVCYTTGTIEHGLINLCSLEYVDKIPDNADMFVSTWALCESTIAAQNYVANTRHWFGAEHFLIATQVYKEQFPEAYNFWQLINSKGEFNTAIPKDSHYILS